MTTEPISSSHPRLLSPLSEATLSDEEIAHILGHFDLGVFRNRENLTLGYINWNCAVETERGRFFLKRRHPALADADLVEAQHALIAHIRARDIPAPEVFRASDSVSYLEHGGHVYEFHEWVQGQPFDGDNPSHLHAVGEMLALFHRATQDFDPPQPLMRRYGWLYGPDVLGRVVEQLERRWPKLDDWWATMREQCEHIARAHPQHTNLPRLVIHGDYYANNILFESNRIIALLDYDNAAHQSRVVEVAEALIYFANQPDNRLTTGVYSGVINIEKAAQFMAAYNGVWPLDAVERSALPATVQGIWLTVSLRRLEERPDAEVEEVQTRLQEAQLLSDWTQAHATDIAQSAA